MPVVLTPHGLGTLDLRKTNWDAWVAGINPEHYWSFAGDQFQNPSLLVDFDGSDAATSANDASSYNHTLTFVGNAQLDTAQSKFGSASLLLDGTGDRVQISDHDAFNLANYEWTIECHVRWNGDPPNDATGDSGFVAQWTSSGSGRAWYVGFRNNQLLIFHSTTGTNGIATDAQNFDPAGDTWYHIAFVRDNSGAQDITRIFVEGVQVGTDNATIDGVTIFNTTSDIWIGGYDGAGDNDYHDGWIDNVRVTKGKALYKTNFTPPAAPFTPDVVASSLAFEDAGSSATLLDGALVNQKFQFGVEGPFGTDPECSALQMTDNIIDAAAFVQNGTNMWTTGIDTAGQLTFHIQRFAEGVSLAPLFQYEGLFNGTNEMRVNINSNGLVQTFNRPNANNNAFQQSPNDSFPDDTDWHMVSVLGNTTSEFRQMLIDGYLIPQKNSTGGDSSSWFGQGIGAGWYHSLTRNRFGPSPGSTTLSSSELGTHRVANFLIDDVEPTYADIQAGYQAFSASPATTFRHLMTALDPEAWWQMYDQSTTGGLAECIREAQVANTLEGTPVPLNPSAFDFGDNRPGSMAFSDDGFYRQGTSIGGNFGTKGSIVSLFRVTDDTDHRALFSISNTGAVVTGVAYIAATSGFPIVRMQPDFGGTERYASTLGIDVADGNWHLLIATQNEDDNGIVWYLDGTKHVAPALAEWDSATDSHGTSSLSNGNRTFQHGSGSWPSVGANNRTQKTSGKWYWETLITTAVAGESTAVGLMQDPPVSGSWLGNGTDSVGAWNTGGTYNGTATTGFASGDTIGHKLDMDLGTYEISVNGGLYQTVQTGLQAGGANDGAGTGWRPAVGGANGTNITANFYTGDISGSVPFGFSLLGDGVATLVTEDLVGPATVNHWFDDVVASGLAAPDGYGIGCLPSNPRLWKFYGNIQDVMITQTVIDDAQATDLWNSIALKTGVTTEGLVVHLDAGETASYSGSGSTWFDISGNSQDFTINNSPTHTAGVNGYFEVNNASDHSFVRTDAALPPATGDFTMSAWIRKSEVSQNAYIWDFGSNGGTASSGTAINSGWRYYNPTLGIGSDVYNSLPGPSVDTWYNYTVVRESGTTTVYVNNSALASSAGDTYNITSTTLNLNKYGGGNLLDMNGRWAAFYMYHRALTPAELAVNQAIFDARYP